MESKAKKLSINTHPLTNNKIIPHAILYNSGGGAVFHEESPQKTLALNEVFSSLASTAFFCGARAR